MAAFAPPVEPLVIRQVFPSWWVAIPPTFDETYVHEGQGYWHAWDEHRSISRSIYVINAHTGPVPAADILDRLARVEL